MEQNDLIGVSELIGIPSGNCEDGAENPTGIWSSITFYTDGGRQILSTKWWYQQQNLAILS